MTVLPAASGITASTTTEAQAKAWLTDVRSYLASLFGSDGTAATALATVGAALASYSAKSGAYTATAADRGQLIDCTGTWALTLPLAATAGAGWAAIVRNGGSGTITLTRAGSDLIDGATTLALAAGRTAVVASTGTAWVTVQIVQGALVSTLGDAQTVTGSKTFTGGLTVNDSVFSLRDNADITKLVQFELSGLTTGTTRTLTVPDASGALAVVTATQTVTGNWNFSGTTHYFGLATGDTTYGFGAASTGATNTKSVFLGTGGVSGSTTNISIGSATAGALGALTIYSPTVQFGSTATIFAIPDNILRIRDNTDPTKQLLVECSGITTGTSRTLTAPDASGVLPVLSLAQTWSAQQSYTAPIKLASYTVATVPSASTVGAGGMIYVSNEVGGATPAFSDGTNWRRVADRAVIA